MLASAALAAAGTFAAVAAASASRRTAHLDRHLAPRLAVKRGRRPRIVAEAVGPLGKWYSQIGVAALCAAGLSASGGRHRASGAVTILASSAIAAVLLRAFDALPQPPVPSGQADRKKAVFPSGHTLSPLAVALTAAGVYSREGLVDARIAIPAALLVPIVTASGKIMARKHWMSDVAGGYAGGLAIALACLAGYEMATGSEPPYR